MMMMALGGFLALVSCISLAAFDFVSGMLTRRYSPFTVIGVVGTVSAVLVGIVIVARGEELLSMGSVAAGILAGACTLAGQAMYLVALARGIVGVVGGISTAFVLVPLGYAIVTGNPPSVVGFAAIALIASGIVLLTLGESEREPGEPRARTSASVVWLAIGAALLSGIAILFIDQGSMADPNSTIFLTYAVTPLALGIAFLFRGRFAAEVTEPLRVPLVLGAVLAAAALAVLGDLALAWSTTFTNVAVTAVITGLDPLVLASFGLLFLRQRLSPVQLIGLVLAVAGGVAAALG